MGKSGVITKKDTGKEVTFDTRNYEAYKEDLIGIHGVKADCRRWNFLDFLPRDGVGRVRF